jgi:acyl transferase domain-containing protein
MRQIAVEQWFRPVQFRRTVEAMHEDGVRIFIEVGPRGNLTAFIDDVLRDRPHLALASNVRHRSGFTQLNHLLAQLVMHGIPLRLEYLYGRDPATNGTRPQTTRHSTRIDLGSTMTTSAPAPPALLGSVPVQQTSEPEIAEEILAPIGAPATRTAYAEPSVSISTAQAMQAHFRTMEQFLAIQQQLMEAFLMGQARPVAPTEAPATAGRIATIPTIESTAPEAGEASLPAGDEVTGAPESPSLDSAATSDITGVLQRIVSEKTGYPIAMVDIDLDLESDLGIDSIKRVEIMSALLQGAEGPRSKDMDALTGCKTLREVAQLLTGGRGAAESVG